MRDVCWRCRRPRAVCYCALLPSLPTKTRVVFLQHPREKRVAIGTARMAHLSLPNSELHQGVVFEDDARVAEVARDPGTAVLFPGEGAHAPQHLPGGPVKHLIVVDGTWSQATKVLKSNPRLLQVRRIGMTPVAPGNYRIRKEPRPECLATVEAVAAILSELEDEPARFDAMLRAFEFMVDRQIEHAEHNDAPRRRQRAPAGTTLQPLWPFCHDPARMVLTYGEANATGRTEHVLGKPELVHLVASRTGGQRFEAFARPRRPLGQGVPHHLEVPAEALVGGEDIGAVLTRFRAFLGDDSVLGTWGTFVADLLHDEGFAPPPCVDLRDLCARQLRARPGGIGNGARAIEALEPSPWARGRAGRMLGWLEVVQARLLELARPDEPVKEIA